jgi:threonine dehydratase
MIELDDVRAAARRLAGVTHRTPVLSSRTLDELVGARVLMKAETFQRGGAFKLRGAYNRISSIPPADRHRVTVSDAQLVEAMRFAFERLKLVVEPSGAAPLAAVMTGAIDYEPGARIGMILSGGNVDRRLLGGWWAASERSPAGESPTGQ